MDKYVKVRKIGQGSFGCAYLATRKDGALSNEANEKQQKQQFVIKEVVLDPRDQANAQREARLLAALDHPNIIACKESFLLKPSPSNSEFVGRCQQRQTVLCIVTEFADGGDLSHELERRSSRRAFFDPDELLGLFVQVCLALKHLHDRKILHRDIKPANIFLTKSGVVKLGDLGVATVLSHTLACAQTAIGTPYYTAPEICLGKRYNAKADVWSLGCVLFELACFAHAFEGRSQRQLFDNIIRGATPQLPACGSLTSIRRELQALVDDTLRKEPRLRPSVNQLIRRPVVLGRIQSFLSARALNSELNHTVLHGQHVFAKKSKPEEVVKPLEQVVRRAEPVNQSPAVATIAKLSSNQHPVKALKKTPPPYGRNGKAKMAALLGNSRKFRGHPHAALRRSRPIQKRLQPSPAPVSARGAVGAAAAVGASKGVKKRIVPSKAKRLEAWAAAKAKNKAKVKSNAAAALPEPPTASVAPKLKAKSENEVHKGIPERVSAFNAKWAAQREQLVKKLAPPPAPITAKPMVTKNDVPKKSKQPARAYPKPVVIAVEGQTLSASKQAPPPAPVGIRSQLAKQKAPSSAQNARGLAARGGEPSLRERRLEFQRKRQSEQGDKFHSTKLSPLDDPIILVQQLPEFKDPPMIPAVLPPPAPMDVKSSQAPPMANLDFERMVLQLKSVVESSATSSDNESDNDDEQEPFDPNAPPPPYSPAAITPSPSFSLEALNISILEDPMFRLALHKRLQQSKPGAVVPLANDGNVDNVVQARWNSELSVVDSAQQKEMLTWMHTYITSLL